MRKILIRGGSVIDGTGRPPFAADVLIENGKIASIGPGLPAEDAEILDAAGLTVCPSFVDIHSHSDDAAVTEEFPVNKLLQGVTSELGGNCGGSVCPLRPEEARSGRPASTAELAALLRKRGNPVNLGMLVGHGNLRVCAFGQDAREAKGTDLANMRALLEREMDAGALGMSLGLLYPPSAFGKGEELVALAKTVAKKDGLVAVHMRNENAGVFDAADEMLRVAEESGVRLELSHLKLMGRDQWGKAEKLIEKIEAARARGVRVTADQYPYCASNTGLSVLFPPEFSDGGTASLLEKLKAPGREAMEFARETLRQRGGAENVFVHTAGSAAYVNRTLAEIAEKLALPPEEAAAKALTDCGGLVSCFFFCMDEADMLTIARRDWVSLGTDGGSGRYGEPSRVFHPRTLYTYPRFLRLNREKGLMPPEAAVRKCTGQPAEVMGLTDRGVLRPGAWADIAVFDPDTVGDTAGYTAGQTKPAGIRYVLVGGTLAAKDGEVLCRTAGTFLRG